MPGLLSIFNRLATFTNFLDGSVYVGRKIENWDYGAKTTRKVADNARGFTRKKEVR